MNDTNGLRPLDSGGLMLSYKCNCRCKHCLYAGSPAWNDWMEVPDAGLIFEGLVRTSDSLRGFHLAGGEPFLDFDRLLRIMRMATEFGIPIEYIETNAGWCIDSEDVMRKFEQLFDAGLRCILVSCSPFHAETIPVNRVAAAVRIAQDVFGQDGVIPWVASYYRQLSDIAQDRSIPLEEYVRAVGMESAKRMIPSGYNLITGGRVGFQLGEFYNHRPPEVYVDERCGMELLESGHAHFDPYGNLMPSSCSGISLGDARDLFSLMTTFDVNRLPVVKTLAEDGPYGLYQTAVKEFGYQADPKGYVGKCHLCVDVRRHIRSKTSEFRELAPAQFYHELGG